MGFFDRFKSTPSPNNIQLRITAPASVSLASGKLVIDATLIGDDKSHSIVTVSGALISGDSPKAIAGCDTITEFMLSPHDSRVVHLEVPLVNMPGIGIEDSVQMPQPGGLSFETLLSPPEDPASLQTATQLQVRVALISVTENLSNEITQPISLTP